MVQKKYKIIFDTNKIFVDDESNLSKLFNINIEDLIKFVRGNKLSRSVQVSIPQLVIDEKISQGLKLIRKQYENLNTAIENLDSISGIHIKHKKFNLDKYKKLLNKNVSEYVSKNKIDIIPTVRLGQDILVERALQKIVPFKAKDTGDSGFKDTLIWLSILKNAKK